MKYWCILFAAARFCHTGVLWAEETLPLAAALQMRYGRTLYRDIVFDKPPLLALTYLAWGAHDGWPLRLAGALYVLLACWLMYRFARDMWGPRKGEWAAVLLGFFLTFDVASAVIPLAADLLMMAPHIAAVWLAYKARSFWSGLLAGVCVLINPKGLLVLAACAVFHPAGIFAVLAGFGVVQALALGSLWAAGGLGDYVQQVWLWGRQYAGATFVGNPILNGVIRTAAWAGFHAALICGAGFSLQRRLQSASGSAGLKSRLQTKACAIWVVLAFLGVVAGMRFFPRYYFQILPPLVLLAAGYIPRGRMKIAFAVLLAIPAIRFAPRYIFQEKWADVAMDRDSRAAAALCQPANSLFVWGFRPEIYVYTRIPAASRFLDSQPLTGVPADRHLTQSQPVTTEFTRANRAELMRSHPDVIVDGLGLYNPALAITAFEDLRPWLAGYHIEARSGMSLIYRSNTPPASRGTR